MKASADESHTTDTLTSIATNSTTISAASVLLGTWESTEAFGTTALDWTQALKAREVQLVLSFESDSTFSFTLFSQDVTSGSRADVTTRFRHVVSSDGRFSLSGSNGLQLEGGVDSSRVVATLWAVS